MTQPIASNSGCGDEEYLLPSMDALMAGTLALMTGYAQADPDGGHRSLMARKLVSQLFFLAGHPQVSPSMRCVLTNLRTHWQTEVDRSAATQGLPAPTPLWHPVPEQLQ